MAELAREYECGEATIWRALQWGALPPYSASSGRADLSHHPACLIHTKELEKHAPVREPSTPRTVVPTGRVLMMVYQEKIVPSGSLPVLASEPPDVLLSQRTWPWMVVWIAAVAVIFGLIGAPLIHLIR
jgi:hypothetical protein